MNRMLCASMVLAWGLSAPAYADYPEMIPIEDPSLDGRTAPEIALSTLTGGQFSLSEARDAGQVVVLAFWASWCGPCQREIPALKILQEDLAGQPVQIVLVNVDKNAQDARRFLRRINVGEADLVVAMDNEAVALGSYGVLSMPTAFVIDRNGTVKITKVGYSEENGLTVIEEAIEEALR